MECDVCGDPHANRWVGETCLCPNCAADLTCPYEDLQD